jgi:hypothetical protein
MLFVSISILWLIHLSDTCSLTVELSQSTMEPIVFENSDKNIPVHGRKTFLKMFINAVEVFDKNLRWAAYFFLNPDKVPAHKNWYGFKSNNPAPYVKELKDFQDDLLKLTKNLEFRTSQNDFMDELNRDLEKIDETQKVIVNADKTSNKYLIEKDDYIELLEKNIQDDYKKENLQNMEKVTIEHQKIVKNLELEERVFETTPRSAFLTVKDHKDNFINNTKCRLLNPTKPEVGKISKKILEHVVNVVKSKSKLRQWKNTHEVLMWFKQLKNKQKKTFILFDVCSFYPSITPELLSLALDWATMYVNISRDEKNIIMQSKKSYLYARNKPWVKKGDKNFDVGMGAFDSAESCDIVGLYLLDQLNNRIKELEVGIYRDDALGVVETTARNAEKIRQKIIQIMSEHGLKITSTANLKVVEFLDVSLDLKNECYRPFIKPGDRPRYVNSKSNHPPSILRNIPLAINKRLSSISSSKEIFDQAAPLYQTELNRGGYTHKLEYQKPTEETKRKRHRKILWFNPPFNTNLKTNVGRKFLNLIDKHFPRGSLLYPLINRYKVKLSYRCMPNMGAQINKHNSKILNQKNEEFRCKCQDKTKCPLPGKCTTDQLVYRATVSSGTEVETYVGLTAGQFKDRYYGHNFDFENLDKKDSTKLSSYIWSLKHENKPYQIKWEVVTRAKPFSAVSGRCDLCTAEKFEILFNPQRATLNSRNELYSHCRHKRRLYLVKAKR